MDSYGRKIDAIRPIEAELCVYIRSLIYASMSKSDPSQRTIHPKVFHEIQCAGSNSEEY